MKLTVSTILGLCLLSANGYALAATAQQQQPQQTAGGVGMQQTQTQTEAEKNKAIGKAFLLANKQKPGVVTLASGLQYKILTPGNGPRPTTNDVVSVNYAGRLINGTEFDSSYKRNQPATFPVSGVIPGWVEALQLMPTGSTWELYIPSDLAYGENGAPPVIGPNEVLIFKVNLIAIQK